MRSVLAELPMHMPVVLQAPRDPKARPYNLLMVHGSPRRVNQFLFADLPEANTLWMMADADVMLFGHTDKPDHKAIPYEDGSSRGSIVVPTVKLEITCQGRQQR